jgi:hypothetical protein
VGLLIFHTVHSLLKAPRSLNLLCVCVCGAGPAATFGVHVLIHLTA